MTATRILATFFALGLLLHATAAGAAGDPRKIMAGSCGCGLWHADEKHADKVPPLFFLRGDTRDAWLRWGKNPTHLMLSTQFDKNWWRGERATAMYLSPTSRFSVGVHLRAEIDCPPDAAGACRSFPVEGTITVTRPKTHDNIKVVGRCGC